jgi:hypothetical protein
LARAKAIWVTNGSAPGTALRLVAIPFELRHVLLGDIEPLLANIDAYQSL